MSVATRPAERVDRDVLDDMLVELRAIRALLAVSPVAHGPHVPPQDDRHARVLPAVAESVAERAFSAREVFDHAVVDERLRAALDAAGLQNPRQLGKLFRRMEGRDIAGVRLQRIGLDRDGIVWRVFRECETRGASIARDRDVV